jgi:type IV secretory pathway VirB6-like protein
LLVLASFLLFSCTDSGCIDADDFGEYESQTIEVSANASQDSCSYDSSLELTDSTQGSGIKACLTQGTTTVTNATGATLNSTKGCYGFDNMEYKTICISGCVQTCLSSVGGADSVGSEPSWNSTDKKGAGQNSGVTIKPGSQIMVRASGSISLGRSIDYPSLFLSANNPLPHSYNSSFQENFFDVRSGQSITVSFSGLVYQGSNIPLGQTSDISSNPQYLYNLARRLVIYTIPHPEKYGGFDLTKTTEKTGVKTVPLLPDPQTWKCSYSGTSLLESTCGNDYYSNFGYANINNIDVASVFPVSSKLKSSILTKYGGVIRWDNDGLNSEDYDPFTASSVTCNGTSGICANITNVPGNQGLVIGDLSAASIDFTNSYNDAYKVSLRSLTGDGGCNSSLALSVLDSGGGNTNQSYTASVINTGWTNDVISLEPGQKLRITQNTARYNATGVNCGKVIGIRLLKYHDLTMEQSGFVRFATLGGSDGSGSCTIKGRIINPGGSYTNSGSYEADFYEYSSEDPMDSVSVPVLKSGSLVSYWAPGALSNAAQIYVRKGQKMRFYPASWNDTWNINIAADKRKCGIGMAMTIDPRPALLCRGSTTEKMSNPDCVFDVNSSGVLIGCQAVSSATECSECIDSSCQDVVTCSAGSSPNYQKTCSGFGARASDSSSCSATTEVKSKCKTCSDKKLANARLAAKIDVNKIDQCYDLEKYTGKVKNIPLAPSSITAVDDFLNGSNAKGAIKLSGFNGDYGNIVSYSDTGINDAVGKKIYSVYDQYLINSDSRLRVIMLENYNVKDSSAKDGMWGAYSDNTAGSGSYTGSNGIKVGLAGGLEFNNGEWMQVQLCQETSDDSYRCKSVSRPDNFAYAADPDQPQIVNIKSPNALTPIGSSPDLTGNYAFDSSGNILRRTGSATGDCTLAIHGIQNNVGSMFYCHTYEYYSEIDWEKKSQAQQEESTKNISKLRLTFKILDPEIAKCAISGSGSSYDGIKLDNPYYEPTTATNVGATCLSTNPPGSAATACKNQFYCANKYANNSGKYYVTVKVKSTSSGSVSSVISAVVKPVIEVMDGKQDNPKTSENESTVGQSERIYKLLIADPRYKAILTVSLVVMITFWGVGYLLGVSELNQTEIITRVFKIGFVYLMVGETGWKWFQMFFVSFFKEGTDYLSFMMAASFDESPELAAAINSGNLYDKSVLFTSVDNVFNLFFSSAVQKKIYALFFASIFGWAYCLIILWSFMHYVYAVSNAVLLYLTAQVFISIMFVVGPIFFVFLLFNQTKDMFDNWLKQLIGFSLQQIFLLITLAFFNMLMYEVIKMSLGYKVCWDEVWVMNLGITRISLMSFWTIASLPPRTNANSQVGNIGNPEGIPSIFTILFIWVISSLMQQFIGFMTDMAANISGGLSASSMGAGISKMASKIKGATVDSAMNRVYSNTVGRALNKIDDKLFDHGKAADDRRAAITKKDASDAANANAAIAAGKAAASKYRAESGDSSAAKSAEAAKKGQKDYLASRGIEGKEADRILSSKGSKIGGARNVAEGLKNAFSNRGTISKSAAEQASDETGKLSGKEFKSLMKNSTPGQRKEHLAKHNSGEMQVSRSVAGQIYDGGVKGIGNTIAGGAIYAASQAAKQAGTALNSGVAAAIKVTTGIDSSDPYQAISNALGNDENRNKARDELIRDGSISKLEPGAEGFRSKEESDLLDAHTAKITQDRKAPAPVKVPTSRANAMAKLDADNADAMDNIDETSGGAIESTVRKAGQQFMTFAKKRIPLTESGKRESQAGALKNQMTKGITANDEELSGLNEKRSLAMQDVNANEEAVISGRNAIQQLREKSAKQRKEKDLKGSVQTYAELKATEEKFHSSKPYRDHQKATAAVHAIDSQISSKKTKGKAMQETLDSVENAEKALEQAPPGIQKYYMKKEFNELQTPEEFKGFSEQYTKANPTK